MKALLVETAFPDLVLHEDQDKPLTISGIASETNKPNGNGRVYPRDIMAREVQKMREDLDSSTRVGLIDHPDYSPSVSDLALKFTDLWMDGDTVRFKAEVIPTQKGRDLEAIIRAGVRVGISSRGYGSAKVAEWNGQRVSMIEEDFELESYDVVVTPSVANARVTQFEAAVREAVERLLDAEGSLTDARWTTAYVNSLPASSFAYVAPDGTRHLPYKDKDGKPDAAHVRNALSRLSQTDIPASAKASARKKLAAAAKELGIDVATKDALETPVTEPCSVQANADTPVPVAHEDSMLDTNELIERSVTMEQQIIAEARAKTQEPTEDEVVDEAAVSEAVADAGPVVEAPAPAAEPVVEDEAPVEPIVETEVVEEPVVEASADPAEPVSDAVVPAAALLERAERAEVHAADLEQSLTEAQAEIARLKEDQGIQLAIAAITSAIATELAEGDWNILSSLANIASSLEYLNHRDDMDEGDHDPATCAYCQAYDAYDALTPRGKATVERALRPLHPLATRIERDRVAFEQTDGKRYGRRMLVLLRQECATAAEVEARLPIIEARVTSEATGQRVLPEIRGVLTVEERDGLTPEQREMRRLAGYRN